MKKRSWTRGALFAAAFAAGFFGVGSAGAQGRVQAGDQRAFAEADTNGDGVLSQDEFEVAMIAPLRAAFTKADKDGNGELSTEEMRVAVRLLADQVMMDHGAMQRAREPQQQPQDRARP